MDADHPTGLERGEAERLLARHGPNALPEPRRPSLLRRVGGQLKSPIIYILAFALLFDLGIWLYEGFAGTPIEAIAIAAILILNTGLGVAQEYRAEAALAKLREMTAPEVWVLRDGTLQRIRSVGLVPGDVVRIEAGDRIPADGRLLPGQDVLVDESVLTGESLPVDKRSGEGLQSGTLIVRGKAHAQVTRTGAASNMGRLATMLGQIEIGKTPLERRMDAFGNRVARWVAGVAIMALVVGLAVEGWGKADELVMFAVALAVAVVPEGLPAMLTLTLALGVQRMARRHAVVRRLTAVEALGSVTVIATDKTGTLTENRLAVRSLDSPDPAEALRAMALANDADLSAGAGDPLEIALVEYARAQDVDVEALRRKHVRTSERAFDSSRKFMRVTVAPDGAAYFKGAPEVLLRRSRLTAAEQDAWNRKAEARAAEGHRVLALARGEGEAEDGLVFLGLVMLWDPPRAEVAAAIRRAIDSGIRIIMVTGDHPATAKAAAEEVGLRAGSVLAGSDVDSMAPGELRRRVREVDVFARVTPEHKLRIVEALQAEGEIVAVTGDGVNDAPALKRSDVGVAMGQRGSDVAREVADLVLTDDNFASIVAAIEEGRSIYENIQKFIRYTFSTNLALLLLIVAGTAISYALGLREATGMLVLPLTATQLLWINFVGDGPPALALALDRNPGTMARPPRAPNSTLLDRASLWFILATGALKGVLGTVLLIVLGGAGILVLRAGVFLYESIAKLVSCYPARRTGGEPPLRNWVLHASIAFGIGLQIAAIFVPWLRRVLGLGLPRPEHLGLIAVAVAVSWLLAELTNRIVRRGAERPRPRLAPGPAPVPGAPAPARG